MYEPVTVSVGFGKETDISTDVEALVVDEGALEVTTSAAEMVSAFEWVLELDGFGLGFEVVLGRWTVDKSTAVLPSQSFSQVTTSASRSAPAVVHWSQDEQKGWCDFQSTIKHYSK